RPGDDRQGAGVRAGRLAMAVGPARRGHGGSIERVLRRPSSGESEVVVLRQQDDHRTSEACMDLARRTLRDPVECREARKTPRELVEAPHGPHTICRDPRLLAYTAGQCRTDNGDNEENYEREQFVRLGDGESVD